MTNQGGTSFDYLLKFIIIGDDVVGKSNLLSHYVHGQFKSEYQSTIGVEFGAKNVVIRNTTYRIQIWDAGGIESLRNITRTYYKNTVCALVVYDISNRNSFNNVSSWIEDCRYNSPKTIFMVLVGNKSDLNDQRKVSLEEGQQMARNNNLMFFETSAKSGENVDKIFEESAKEIDKKINEGYYDLESDICGIKRGLNLGVDSAVYINGRNMQPKKKKCCF